MNALKKYWYLVAMAVLAVGFFARKAKAGDKNKLKFNTSNITPRTMPDKPKSAGKRSINRIKNSLGIKFNTLSDLVPPEVTYPGPYAPGTTSSSPTIQTAFTSN